jgi:putative endonuclease
MVTNKTQSVLYIGVTNGLLKRAAQHHAGEVPGFTQHYHCARLVYYEHFGDIRSAIAREKQLKGWRREKKNALIAKLNPQWKDLAVEMMKEEEEE